MPPERVLAAFGARGPASRLAGGQGTTWACPAHPAALVLKPTDDPEESAWLAELTQSLPRDGFRVAEPVRAADGSWVVDGWTAQRRVEGTPGIGDRWELALATARAFSSALAHAPYAPLLARRTHRWARADRVAWQEEAPSVAPQLAPLVRQLLAGLRPLALPAQLVHADLAGNLLLAEGLPPAVIDLSLYWRPARWAEAQLVVDGLLWYGAPVALLDGDEEWRQLVLRSCAFRLVALDGRAREDREVALRELPDHERVAELLSAR